jgi:hypothetical protein
LFSLVDVVSIFSFFTLITIPYTPLNMYAQCAHVLCTIQSTGAMVALARKALAWGDDALSALVPLNGDMVRAILSAATSAPTRAVRMNTIAVLGVVGRVLPAEVLPSLCEAFVACLADDEWWVVVEACNALFECFGAERGEPAFARQHAAATHAHLTDALEAALPRLQKRFARDTAGVHDHTQLAAAVDEALGNMEAFIAFRRAQE